MTRLLLLTLTSLTLLCGPVAAKDRYFSIMLGSWHFGNDDLNNTTPGLTLGQRWDGVQSGTEWFLEGGVFYNSYEEISPIALLGTSASLGHIGKTEIRAGFAVGTAYYEDLSGRLKARYGIPNIAGFIPIAAASIALRQGRSEMRFTAVPPDTDTNFILNISLTHSF